MTCSTYANSTSEIYKESNLYDNQASEDYIPEDAQGQINESKHIKEKNQAKRRGYIEAFYNSISDGLLKSPLRPMKMLPYSLISWVKMGPKNIHIEEITPPTTQEFISFCLNLILHPIPL
ncbi:MAG: hypothetical protein ACMUEM_00070 [Flavobacteriales bacterium AspAUS03]